MTWHALLAPLPAAARVTARPVVSREALAAVTAAGVDAGATAGWTQRVVELSAGVAGLRIVLVVLDADGRAISASDMVLRRDPPSAGDGDATDVAATTESIGGRITDAGRFEGTRWTVAREPLAPTDAEVAALHALVADVLARPVRHDAA